MKKNTGKGSANFSIEKVRAIKELAKESIGLTDYPTEYFRYVIKTMLHYIYLKRDLTISLREAIKKTPYEKLNETFGLSTVSIAAIVGEIEDVRKFPNHKQFASYCGFGIYENTSGSSINKSSRLSKRGNKLLRKTFYQLVLTNLSYKTEVYQHYLKLKEKGKHPKKCLVATARKIAIRTYYDMLKCHEK